MEPIRPLHEDHIKQFCGMPVCMILKDGTRHVGTLTACRDGHVFLNGGEDYHDRRFASAGISAAKPASKNKGKKGKAVKAADKEPEAHTQAFPFRPGYPYGPGGAQEAAPGFGHPGGYPPYGYGFGWGPAIGVSLAALAFLLLLI
ncbi:hypothetical protein HGI30_06490 [Paenibacillus albicereus]|uniref:Uncharacterized protein n=1 Tax=Paenibacillus albicereus TaxID=2726185 RepID=A0A6H2GV49_9BACL|nr:hypothetical protein [Paenibacillus albicereus]QJC51229.1 hypothetical protein HGI30_06490 [Paenibacillus albicereus]